MQISDISVVKSDAVTEVTVLVEGAEATVIVRGANNGFTLTVKQEEAVLESLSQIDRGDWISLEDLMVTLPRPVDPTP
jgi:hypothetical protein